MLFRAPWATGVKTGHTLGAGYVLVGSGTRGGVELISAVLGAPSEAQRDADSLELLDYGFSLYRRRTIVQAGRELASRRSGTPAASCRCSPPARVVVGLRAIPAGSRWTRGAGGGRGADPRGRRLGSAVVDVDGRRVAGVPLLAARSIPEAGFIDRVLDSCVRTRSCSRLPGA